MSRKMICLLGAIIGAEALDQNTIGAYMTAAAARGGTVTITSHSRDDCGFAGTTSTSTGKGLCNAGGYQLPLQTGAVGSPPYCDKPFFNGVCFKDYTGKMEVYACSADNTKVHYATFASTTECSGALNGAATTMEFNSGDCIDVGDEGMTITCTAGAVYTACTYATYGCCDGDDTTMEANQLKTNCVGGAAYVAPPTPPSCASTTYGCCDGTDTTMAANQFKTNCVGGTSYTNAKEAADAAAAVLAAAGGMAIGVLVAVIVIPIVALVLLIVGIVCCCKHCGKSQASQA